MVEIALGIVLAVIILVVIANLADFLAGVVALVGMLALAALVVVVLGAVLGDFSLALLIVGGLLAWWLISEAAESATRKGGEKSQSSADRAVEILEKHQIGLNASKLLRESRRYQSTEEVRIEKDIKREFLPEGANAVMLRYQEREIIVATTRSTGLIFLDGEMVLETSIGAYGDFPTRFTKQSIISMKAGVWLEMLSPSLQQLELGAWQRSKAEQDKRERDRASKIDLGNY